MSDSRFTATKFDAKKPPMDLIPWEAMEGVARVLDFGRVKYSAHNWRKGFEWCRLAGAGLRHTFKWLSGEECDEESGESHIDHAICCFMFLSAHIKSGLGKDDRAHKLLSEPQMPAARVPVAKTKRYQWCVTDDDGITPDLRQTRGPAYVSREYAQHALKQLIEVGTIVETLLVDGGFYVLAEIEVD